MVTMPSRVLSGETRREMHRCWRLLRVLLWSLSLLRVSGCAQCGCQSVRAVSVTPDKGSSA